MRNFLLICLSFVLLSLSDPFSFKRVSDADFRYEFYTTKKTVKAKHTINYYWFKGGLVHNTEGGIAGQLLHAEYKKYFHSNQLAENGVFKNGIKVGLWKTWFENGATESTQEYSHGQKHGKFFSYTPEGKMHEKGSYRFGKKHGYWINYSKQDTMRYKRGVLFVPKPKLNKEEKAALKIEKEKEREFKKEERLKRKEEKLKIKEEKLKSKAAPKNQPKKNLKEGGSSKFKNWFDRTFKKKTNGKSK